VKWPGFFNYNLSAVNNASKAIWITVVVFVVAANMLGNTMAKRVGRESGKTYWPSAANTRLARDYRALYGPDRNYLAYCFSHLALLAGVLVWALYGVLIP
jgi:hypothetical protein